MTLSVKRSLVVLAMLGSGLMIFKLCLTVVNKPVASGKELALYCRRRATWKQFCETLSSGPLSDTTATIKRIRRNRTMSPSYSHPEGPTVAATTMANHLKQVFSGSSLPFTR
ncbi:hypothetical protein G6F40_016712 [Rhizopus arrhizus]|nr:hypothetical protein G6F40_016712 [Rhizopus arrhizus]